MKYSSRCQFSLLFHRRMNSADGLNMHPLLGRIIFNNENTMKRCIYTRCCFFFFAHCKETTPRTVVLWAVNVKNRVHFGQKKTLYAIDTAKLTSSVRVSNNYNNRHFVQPVVRMISTSNTRRGSLKKRLRRTPFRSVLSIDVQYNQFMPNLKISIVCVSGYVCCLSFFF